jgi:hypothetical protein
MLVTSLLATYSFHRAIAGGRLGWWVSYSAASGLAAFSFVSVIFLFIAHGLYLVWTRSKRTGLSKWIACQLATFVLFAAWFSAQYGARLGPGLTKTPGSISVRHTPDQEVQRVFDLASTIPYTFFAFSTGFSLGPSVPELHLSRSITTLRDDAPVVIPVGILFASLFVLGLMQLRRHSGTASFVLLWLGVPIALVFMASAMTSFGVYNVRYVGVALPAYLLILAAGICDLRQPKIQFGLLAAVLIVNGLALGNYYFDTRYARADARAAAQYLESALEAGDVIVAVGNPMALRYYYKGGLPIHVIDARGAKGSVVAQNLRELANAHNRLWLVEIRAWETDPQARVKAGLENLARPGDHKTFPGVEIYSYQVPDLRL